MTKADSVIFLVMCIGAAIAIPFSAHKETTQIGAMAYLQLPLIALTLILTLYFAHKRRMTVLSTAAAVCVAYVVATAATNGMILLLRTIR